MVLGLFLKQIVGPPLRKVLHCIELAKEGGSKWMDLINAHFDFVVLVHAYGLRLHMTLHCAILHVTAVVPLLAAAEVFIRLIQTQTIASTSCID